jgi:hypothetical protein
MGATIPSTWRSGSEVKIYPVRSRHAKQFEGQFCGAVSQSPFSL